MTDERPEDMAAEYALRLLEGEELHVARQLAKTDPAFAEEVARWRGRVASLAAEIPEIRPPDAVWERINRSLGPDGGDTVVAFRRRLNRWRGATAAATAVAASLALMLVTRDFPRTIPTPSTPIVSLIKAGTEVAAVASWDRGSRRLVVSEVNMPVSPGHDYQLWLIPAGGKPHSLGVMPNAPHMQLALTEGMIEMVRRGSTLAVSLEPAGGSRTDGPSGPVVASGSITTA